MTELWLPTAVRHNIGNTAPMNGGPSRVTHHTTSNTNDHSFANESAYFASGGRAMAPHFVADPFTGQIAQYFPADSRALALQNAIGEQTNRTGKYNIQIEWVFTQGETINGKKYNSLAETPMKPWPLLRAYLKSLGIAETFPNGVPNAWTRHTASMDMWRTKGGHYGHRDVPGNSHVDPGPMNNLFTGVPTPPKSPTIAYASFPGVRFFIYGKQSPIIAAMHKRLVAVGCNRYKSTRDQDIWSSGDIASYKAFQIKLGYKGADADGVPGAVSWAKLQVPRP